MSKVVIVTGASRGIGRNIAYNLAINGYKVIANYNNSEEEALKLKKQVEDKGLEIDLFKATEVGSVPFINNSVCLKSSGVYSSR